MGTLEPELTGDLTINPYAAPMAEISAEASAGDLDVGYAEEVRKKYLTHETSVRGIGSLMLLGAAAMGAMGVAFFAGWDVPSPEGRDVARYGLAGVRLALAALYYAVGIGLRKLLGWARWTGVALAVLSLLTTITKVNMISIGMSLYILGLLLSKKSATVFSPEYREIVARTPHIRYQVSWLVKLFLVILMSVVLLILIGVAAIFSNR